jgi:hypothetical protein
LNYDGIGVPYLKTKQARTIVSEADCHNLTRTKIATYLGGNETVEHCEGSEERHDTWQVLPRHKIIASDVVGHDTEFV